MTEVVSPYITAGIAGWIISQLLKYVVSSLKNRRIGSFRQLYLSGNMPSAHSTTVVAVLTVIGLYDGVGSGLFGLALVVAAVVLYDAMMVRRSSGEQGRSLTELIKEQKSQVRLPRVAMGHTPIEVAVGALLGVIIGASVFYLHIF